MIYNEIGKRIRALRLEKRLTLEEVGNYVGVSKTTVKKWEDGVIQNMRTDKVTKLAKCLGVTEGYLLGYDDEPKPEIIPIKKVSTASGIVDVNVDYLYQLDDESRILIEYAKDRTHAHLLQYVMRLRDEDIPKAIKAIGLFLD